MGNHNREPSNPFWASGCSNDRVLIIRYNFRYKKMEQPQPCKQKSMRGTIPPELAEHAKPMNQNGQSEMTKDISCRVTRTLLLYIREKNNGRLGSLLDGLPLDEAYLSDANNWVSHAFLQILYKRMIDLLGDDNAVYDMTLASERLKSLGILDRIVRLLGSPKLIYSQAPKYNQFLKLNGSVVIHDIGDSWVVLEDRYNDSAQKTRFDCDYTRGILAGIPTVFDLPPAEVEEIKCQVAQATYGRRRWPDHPSQGSDGCLYRVSWLPRRTPFLKRFFLGRSTKYQAVEDLVQANRLIQSKYDEVKRLATDLKKANQELIKSKRALESQKAKLMASERKYRNLFENGSDLIGIHDLDGNLLETNIPFKKKYGWQSKDLEGVNLRQLIPERHRSAFDAYLARILENGSDDGYTKAVARSGREITLEYRNKLILDDRGQPTAVQAAARDVTERIRYEKALKESEAKYKQIVKHAPAGIFEIDLEKITFISVNDVICEYTGFTEHEMLQMDPLALFSESSREKARKRLEQVFSTQRNPAPTDYVVQCKDGRQLPVVMTSKYFFENGVPKRLMAVVHDLSEVRKAEEEKRSLEKKLQNARKLESLGTLAGGVAHDLNNILSGIVSYPDLLLMDLEADNPLRQPLLAMQKSGEKAAEIVQDLLTLARHSVAHKRVVSLNDIVNDFVASPEHAKIVGDHHDIRIQTRLAGNMLNVMGSEIHLSKTVMNLVTNAAEAMPAGGTVTITTRDCYIDGPLTAFEVIPEGEYAVLEISDMGIGMHPSDLDRIFEPFYTKKVMGRSGTGLGMSVVWGTVKDHDGFFDIITEEGTGSTFILYLPATRAERPTSHSIRIEDFLGTGESILIVDDVMEQRDLAGRMMQRLGYRVTTADSGEAALVLIKQNAYDLLILDMIMPPGMNGLETYRAILEVAPGQKAIIASGYAQTDLVREARQLGAGSYIKKPYTLEKIGLAVRAELSC